jgi:uncharacterized protein YbaR (Trm112 family)
VKNAERGGAYDIATEEMRQEFRASAVMTIVLGGIEGTQFCVSGPEDIKPLLPALFRSIADEVERGLLTERHVLICPACHQPLAFDPRMKITTRDVKEGSIAICAACASPLTLDAVVWRVMSQDELLELDDHMRHALLRAQRNIRRRRSQVS